MLTQVSAESGITVRDLSKKFESDRDELLVLQSLTFGLEPGEVSVILGPSGCGKSTLLNILASLDRPTSGVVNTANDLYPYGVVFQRDRLFPWRTVYENAILGAQIRHTMNHTVGEKAHMLLHELGLQGFETKYPGTLSEGMRQRVALIRALIVEPRILLLDEPFSSLDLEMRLRAEMIVRRYTRDRNCVTVLVTHDLEESVAIADKIVLLTRRPARVKGSWRLPKREIGISHLSEARNDPEIHQVLNDLTAIILEENVVTHG